MAGPISSLLRPATLPQITHEPQGEATGFKLWFPNTGKEGISDLGTSPPGSVLLLLTGGGPAWSAA